MIKTAQQGIEIFKKELKKAKQKEFKGLNDFSDLIENKIIKVSEADIRQFVNRDTYVLRVIIANNEELKSMIKVLRLSVKEIKKINKETPI